MKPLTLFIFLAGFLPASQGAPGDLDLTLAGTGKMRVLPGGGLDAGHAVARQGDGKLIVAGESVDLGTTVPSLVRYHSNGTLDTTFGSGGKVLLSSVFGGARAVAVVPVTNQILVAGYATLSPGNSTFLLMRLHPNGTLDNAFDGNGILFTDFTPGDDRANAMALQTDGRIVLAGYAGSQLAIARYDANGVPDTSFDTDGRLTSTYAQTANAVLLPSATNSKIIVAGRSASFNGVAIALRFNFNGTLDTSFDQDGMHVQYEADNCHAVTLLAIQAGEEKLIFTGGSPGGLSGGPVPVPVPPELMLWSLNAADGSLDTTFAGGGTFSEPDNPGQTVRIQLSGGVASRIVVGLGSSTVRRFTLTGGVDSAFGGGTGRASAGFSGEAMLVQPDGRIVVAGNDNGDVASGRFTAAGVPDTSFSGDGVRLDNLGNVPATARAIAVQPDGKLLLAGDFTVVRLLPDGSFDPSFDDDGKVSVDFTVHALALQPDGHIVLAGAGTEGGLSIVRLARLTAGGAFTFGMNDANPRVGAVSAVAIQPDGKIVAAGWVTEFITGTTSLTRFAVFRFLATGAIDTSIGDRGALVWRFIGGDSSARGIAIAPDGRIVAAGAVSNSIYGDVFCVVRLLATGAVDASFSGDGIAVIPVGTGHDYAESVALQNDKIIVAGTVDAASDDIGLIRLHADGELDTGFGTGGKVIVSLSAGDDTTRALLVQRDGKLIVAGSSTNGAATEMAVVRFSENGTPDATFGAGGQMNIDFTPGNLDAGYAIALDSVQRIVAVGSATDRYGIARVLGDPFLELTGMTRQSSTGLITVHGKATPGYACSLRSAPNLTPASFPVLSALTPDASGSWQYSHTPSVTRLFYKATRP